MSQYNDDQVIDPALLAALQDGLTPVSPSADLRGRILDRIRTTPDISGLVTIRGGIDGWRTLNPGIDYKMLTYDETGKSKSFLLRAQAGTRMPAHAHHGYEECLVLEGEFCIGDLTLHAGDFHGAGTDVEHVEAYTKTGVTVYLRANIRDYPGIGP